MKHLIRRFIVMAVGLIIMGLGVAVFKISLMGNDPSTAMVMAIGDKVGISFSIILIGMHALCFLGELFFGRKYIGLGTFANWFGVGTITSLWINWLNAHFTVPDVFAIRLLVMFVGVLILSLSASMYQTSDLGIAPYDSVSILMAEKLPIPYFWCRMITDSVCALTAFLFGGLIGLGTLTCAVGLGPFIAFFNRFVSEKLCGVSRSA
ncbi:MAG: YitT family protein [Candidatus Faecivicinus sp.]